MKINWIILTAIFTLAATQIQETKAKKDPKMISEKSTDNSSWKDFKTKYQKNFRNPNEDVFRGFKFEKNKKKINQHNAKAKSSRTWNM